METGFFRFANHERYSDPGQVYTTSLISLGTTSALFIVAGCLLSPQLAGLLDCGAHPAYIWMMVVAVGADAFTSIPFAYLRYRHRPMRFASLKLVNIGLNIGLNLFFILLCPWLWRVAPESIGWFYDPGFGIGYIFLANMISSLAVLALAAAGAYRRALQLQRRAPSADAFLFLPAADYRHRRHNEPDYRQDSLPDDLPRPRHGDDRAGHLRCQL